MRVALIGLGTMGPGMAARLARGGHAVAVHDVAPAAMERARSLQPMIATALDRLGVGGRRRAPSPSPRRSRRRSAGADLVIENVPENVEVKAEVYRASSTRCSGRQSLLATDTSGIPITTLQAHVANPARFVGHALVEPAAHHPDDRGHRGGADGAGDGHGDHGD